MASPFCSEGSGQTTASGGITLSLLGHSRFLAIYSGLLTLAWIVTVAVGVWYLRNPAFQVVTARRINIVEPDGTVRLTLSNRADFPGGWNRGREYERPDRRDAAGLLFMSEEGTEQGGLIWGAGQQPDGSVQNHAHLSFDQYEENQVFALDAGQEGSEKFSLITMTDQGDYGVEEKRRANDAITKLPPDKQDEAWRKFFATHRHDVSRLSLGRGRDASVGLRLLDQNGKLRAALVVDPAGNPALQFYDAAGQPTRRLGPEN